MSKELATEGPRFVPPYRLNNSGVDFLGMRQVNLDMMSNCLPGINNVTSYIRPFSVVSWIYWKFYELSEQKHPETVTAGELRVWKEKVETLFTWGHKLNRGKVPGTDAKPPGSGSVPLDFAAWKRSAQNTSLMAAVQYGPAAKTVAGFGFLEPLPQGRTFFQTVGPGVEMAQTLDAILRGFELLTDIGPAKATANDANSLYKAWSIFDPSPSERKIFRSVFFEPSAIGEATYLGRRSATVQLALEMLTSIGKPVSAEMVRILMFQGAARKGAALLDPGLKSAWLRWVVLQIRQSQRLAMEGLLCWLETLLVRDYRDTEAIVQETLKAIKDHDAIFPPFKPAHILQIIQEQAKTLDHILTSAGSKSDLDLFHLMKEIVETTKPSKRSIRLAPLCLRTLFLCAVLTDLLQSEAIAKSETQRGASERLSLSFWTSRLVAWSHLELGDFLRQLYETLILSQHFTVAARRFDGQSQRLRISIEENGLELLARKPLVPSLAPDRLNTALSLMHDCGLIGWNKTQNEYFAK